MKTAPWQCPGCKKTATVNLDALPAIGGTVRCTCGRVSIVKPPQEEQP